MRKILLGTTGVVGAALIGLGAAQAQEAPRVTVGGFMLTQMNWQDDTLDGKGTGNGVGAAGNVERDAIDFKNEVEIVLNVTGKAANGLAYGAVIEIQNDGTGGSVMDLDEAYVFVGTPTLGQLRFGEEDSAANLLQVRHPALATSGTDGDWDDGIASAQAFTGGGPSLVASINDANDSTKIIYLSPQFAGFDFGLSYTPNRNEGDRIISARALDALPGSSAATNGHRDANGLTNEISAALRYRGTFGGVGIAAGFGYMQADGARATNAGVATTTLEAEDMRAYTVGLTLAAFGFTVGGEYTWGQYQGTVSAAPTAKANQDDSSHFALGVTYTTGAISVGAFYGAAEQDTNTGASAALKREQTVWGISGLYAIAPGLDVYATYAQLEDNNVNVGTASSPRVINREATVFLLGTRIAF
jgi:predicted porin